MEARIKELNCVDVTPPESPVTLENSNGSATNRYLSKPETDFSAFSDSEVTVRQSFIDAGVNNSSKANVRSTIITIRSLAAWCAGARYVRAALELDRNL